MRLKAPPLWRRVAALLWAASIVSVAPTHAETGRTFVNEIACAKAAGMTASTCRQVFAAARIEFEAKTRSYPSRFACYRAYGPCMPWPADAAPFAHFRPQWMGATVHGADVALSAMPLVAPGRIALAFAPRPLGDTVVTAASPPLDRDRPVVSGPRQLCREIATMAGQAGLPPAFLARLLWQESSFRADVVSPAGARGIAQFMPSTAQERGLDDPFDAARAIETSALLLGALVKRFGNLGLAAAAYNGGPTRVSGWLKGQRSLAAETQAYVQRITGRPVEDWAAGAGDDRTSAELSAPCLFDGPADGRAPSPQSAAQAGSMGSSIPTMASTSSASAR